MQLLKFHPFLLLQRHFYSCNYCDRQKSNIHQDVPDRLGEREAVSAALRFERGLAVAPLHARTRRQGLWGMSTQFAGDLFHPNDRGYRVWASAFEPLVDSRVREL